MKTLILALVLCLGCASLAQAQNLVCVDYGRGVTVCYHDYGDSTTCIKQGNITTCY